MMGKPIQVIEQRVMNIIPEFEEYGIVFIE